MGEEPVNKPQRIRARHGPPRATFGHEGARFNFLKEFILETQKDKEP